MTGSSNDRNILVLGGDSRLGRALRRNLAPRVSTVVRRVPVSAYEHATTDYASIPPAALDGIDAVINCIGTPQGSADTLWHINARIPLAAARQAKAAGIRRFVQISSFSVYGGKERIGCDTPVAPVSAYGHAKAHADIELTALANSHFMPISLRLPAIVDLDGRDKLHSLIRLWRRIRYLPAPRTQVSRSMIGVDLAARAVLRSLDDKGVVHAADPAPFEYERAALILTDALGRNLSCFHPPRQLFRLLALTAPAIHESLYRDSLLSPDDNIVATEREYPGLYDIIAAIAHAGV